MKSVLEKATLTMDRTEARKAFLEYRDAVRTRHNAEDEMIMRGYRAMAMGKQVINIRQVISAGGEFENGMPKLAVAQADLQWAHVERFQNGGLRFLPAHPWDISHNRRKGIYQFPAGTLSELRQNWQLGSNVRAMVPPVPPALRPAHALSNYEILFEVDKWERAPRPPGDPALLKHIGGELYAVLAIWDLSPLEQAVLSARVFA